MNKIKEIKIGDSSYPKNLLYLDNPPKKLYVLGNEAILQEKSIAIIGCRNCSNYGEIQAYQFGYQLAEKGIHIVSGLARGVDTYSHVGTIARLKRKKDKEIIGKAIAVIGSGLDVIYPPENRKLFQEIVKTGGAIISEYPLGSKPEKQHFPERNRIISGLSSGVLVVEAAKRSGTMITVEYALEQGKDVYAIPGDISRETSFGTNELIKQGAIPVTCIDDFYNL